MIGISVAVSGMISAPIPVNKAWEKFPAKKPPVSEKAMENPKRYHWTVTTTFTFN
jgi:hypothetical protein